jgi:hypothetical protein
MSVDSYLFIDRETARVYVRSASKIYGGFSGEAVRGETESYQGKDYKDAVRWSSKYEPIEYGIYTGTLCLNCEREVEDGKNEYPLCHWCYLIDEVEKNLTDKSAKSFQLLVKEIKPYLP